MKHSLSSYGKGEFDLCLVVGEHVYDVTKWGTPSSPPHDLFPSFTRFFDSFSYNLSQILFFLDFVSSICPLGGPLGCLPTPFCPDPFFIVAPSHPGGQMICEGAKKDATVLFTSNHHDYVLKEDLPRWCIGRISPEEILKLKKN